MAQIIMQLQTFQVNYRYTRKKDSIFKLLLDLFGLFTDCFLDTLSFL